MRKNKIELTIDIEKIYTAKRCLNYCGFGCSNETCVNIACPLNKKWKDTKEDILRGRDNLNSDKTLKEFCKDKERNRDYALNGD